MMKSNQIVADNMKKLYELTGLKSAGLCAMAEGNGISLSTSTVSRFLNGANAKIDTFDSLVDAVRLIKGFEWVDHSVLLTPNAFQPTESSQIITSETLKEHYFKLLNELHDIGWVKVSDKPGMDSIVDFCIHTFKKTGFSIAESGINNAASRFGS